VSGVWSGTAGSIMNRPSHNTTNNGTDNGAARRAFSNPIRRTQRVLITILRPLLSDTAK
jgi:hypothetical protein